MATYSFPDTFSAHADGRAVAWSALDTSHVLDGSDIAGGLLMGDETYAAEIRDVLSDPLTTEVTVAHPGVRYVFSEGRDTPADVAAAMIYVGRGRAILSESGWEVLNAAMSVEDEGDDPEVFRQYSYNVRWSEEDGSVIGMCEEFPSLSFTAKTAEDAAAGIETLVEGVVRDMVSAGERVPSPTVPADVVF